MCHIPASQNFIVKSFAVWHAWEKLCPVKKKYGGAKEKLEFQYGEVLYMKHGGWSCAAKSSALYTWCWGCVSVYLRHAGISNDVCILSFSWADQLNENIWRLRICQLSTVVQYDQCLKYTRMSLVCFLPPWHDASHLLPIWLGRVDCR